MSVARTQIVVKATHIVVQKVSDQGMLSGEDSDKNVQATGIAAPDGGISSIVLIWIPAVRVHCEFLLRMCRRKYFGRSPCR